MKTINVIVLMVMALSLNLSCSSQTNEGNNAAKVSSADDVSVYYFHYTRRCATCNAVESVSKEALTEMYGNKVAFTHFNLDEEAGKAMGDKLDVSGQTLLIVAGDKHINITNEGFMNARSNPEKLKSVIKEKIDPFIN